MTLDMLSEMIESYRAGDLDLVEDLYTEGEELIEREGPFYHNTQGRFSSAASASSLSMGDNGPKYKMSGGKRKGQVKVCGRLARRSRTNKLCSTGKFPSYYKGGKGRGQRARGAAPSVAAEPAAQGGGRRKAQASGKKLAQVSGKLRQRGVDLTQVSDRRLRKTARDLAVIQKKARTNEAADRAEQGIQLIAAEMKRRGYAGDFAKKAKETGRAAMIVGGNRRASKSRAAVAEDENDDLADMLAPMLDEGGDEEEDY